MIWDNGNILIRLDTVQHVEWVHEPERNYGVVVVTKFTRWNFEHDTWENSVWIDNSQGDAEHFIARWKDYTLIHGGENDRDSSSDRD